MVVSNTQSQNKTEYLKPSCQISKMYKTNKNQALQLVQILDIILSKYLTFQHFYVIVFQ